MKTAIIIALILLMGCQERPTHKLEFKVMNLEDQIEELNRTVDMQGKYIQYFLKADSISNEIEDSLIERMSALGCSHIKLQQQLIKFIEK